MAGESTRFKKGEAPGRPKGAVNVINKTVKETVLEVFRVLQKDPNHSLEAFAKKYPRDYYAIAAKLIPTEIKADVHTPEGITIILGRDSGCKPVGTNPEDIQEGNTGL
jgi:hypothetical protein